MMNLRYKSVNFILFEENILYINIKNMPLAVYSFVTIIVHLVPLQMKINDIKINFICKVFLYERPMILCGNDDFLKYIFHFKKCIFYLIFFFYYKYVIFIFISFFLNIALFELNIARSSLLQ